MRDEIVRAIACNGTVKALAISGKTMVERARKIHRTLPVGTAALGRCLLAASMMGSDLKQPRGSLTLRVQGSGPLGVITAVSDAKGRVRGYLQNPAVDIARKAPGKLDVGSAVGLPGRLTVVRDLCMKEPYVGSVALVSGEIAEDIAAYFARSEQLPTACALGVLVDTNQAVTAAGGYLISLLPGATEEIAEALEQAVQAFGPVSKKLAEGMSAEEMLRAVLEDLEPEIVSSAPVSYRCACSRARVTRALQSLGRSELEQMIREQGEAELTCQFCDRVYRYSREELEEVLAGLK
jgi:molecular chaperone Hsp33